MSRCLCSTFEVQHVQQLGHGSVQRLLHLCSSAAADASSGSSHESQSCVWSVHALAAPAVAANGGAAAAPADDQLARHAVAQYSGAGPAGEVADLTGGVLGSASSEDALRCLAAAPPLAELHSWSSWRQVRAAAAGWPLFFFDLHPCRRLLHRKEIIESRPPPNNGWSRQSE